MGHDSHGSHDGHGGGFKFPLPLPDFKTLFSYALVIALAVVALSALTNADSLNETHELISVASVPDALVVASGDLNFDATLPGYDYSRDITVTWHLPEAALRGITADKVTVFVQATSLDPVRSHLYFDKDRKRLFFNLTCVVVDDACSINSTLVRVFTVRFSNSNLSALPYADRIVIHAALAPFPEEQADAQLAGLSSKVSTLESQLGEFADNVSFVQEASAALDAARAAIDKLDLQSANATVSSVESAVQLANQTKNGDSKLTFNVLGAKADWTYVALGASLVLIAGYFILNRPRLPQQPQMDDWF